MSALPKLVATSCSRREMLKLSGGGFGSLAMAATLQSMAHADARSEHPATHFPAKAKRVLFLFMNGAPSHVDTFDPKPALAKHAGEQPEKIKTKGTGYLPSPFRFKPHGESGS